MNGAVLRGGEQWFGSGFESQVLHKFELMKKLKLVAALNEEVHESLSQYKPLITGIGSVNAALSLERYLSCLSPSERSDLVILNIGTAGSFKREFRYVNICDRFYSAPILINTETNISENDSFVFGDYGSSIITVPFVVPGKTFMNSIGWSMLNDFDFFDMESYALAAVCNYYKVGFFAMKVTSDSGIKSLSDFFASLGELSIILKTNLDLFISGGSFELMSY